MGHRLEPICLVLFLAFAGGCGRAEGDLLTPACGPASVGAREPCPDSWPNEVSRANSDPWLSAHHDELVSMRPRVLLLHFYNQLSREQARVNTAKLIAAIAEGSRYHGYASPFLQYDLVNVVDLRDASPPAGYLPAHSTKLPTTADGSIDFGPLFSPAFADLYQMVDERDPSHNLTLCQLFEKGVINEVWLHLGEPSPPSSSAIVERRQVYDEAGRAKPGVFRTTAGTPAQVRALDDTRCAVTVRMVLILPLTTPQFDSEPVGRDVACSLMAHGFGIETMAASIPYLTVHARPFLNLDLRSRFGVSFDGWRDICSSNFAPCVGYEHDASSQAWIARAASGAAVGAWTMNPFRQGCGTVDFPPNARFRWDFDNHEPNQTVASRCEDYGQGHGPDGDDAYEPYLVDIATGAQGPDNCGPAWQKYWRQSIPGYGNAAIDSEGHPMKNWWPFLFY